MFPLFQVLVSFSNYRNRAFSRSILRSGKACWVTRQLRLSQKWAGFHDDAGFITDQDGKVQQQVGAVLENRAGQADRGLTLLCNVCWGSAAAGRTRTRTRAGASQRSAQRENWTGLQSLSGPLGPSGIFPENNGCLDRFAPPAAGSAIQETLYEPGGSESGSNQFNSFLQGEGGGQQVRALGPAEPGLGSLELDLDQQNVKSKANYFIKLIRLFTGPDWFCWVGSDDTSSTSREMVLENLWVRTRQTGPEVSYHGFWEPAGEQQADRSEPPSCSQNRAQNNTAAASLPETLVLIGPRQDGLAAGRRQQQVGEGNDWVQKNQHLRFCWVSLVL